jgi:hypothetical protein
MIKARIDSSGIMIYAQGDSTTKRIENSKQFLSQPRQSGKIGQRGKQLVKLYCKLLGETILAYREADPVGALREGINAVFITLTLPATQKHDDGELNRHALGRFITEARRSKWFEHYVWRAEVQKNGNAHWHILVDHEVDALEVRKLWNRIMADLGYIERYRKKMEVLTLDEYIEMRKPKDDDAMKRAISAFNTGKSEGWNNPNATDTQRVRSISGLKKYVSKYMSKSTDAEARDWHSRHWGASDSLRDLQELRVEVPIGDVSGLMQDAVNLDLYVVGLDHCTYIRANSEELRLLKPEWYERLKCVQTSNRQALFTHLIKSNGGETDELDELDFGLLDSLYFTVCQSQMELSFDMYSR